MKKSIVKFFDDADVQNRIVSSLNNTVAGELGVKTEEDLHHFTTAVLPEMKLVRKRRSWSSQEGSSSRITVMCFLCGPRYGPIWSPIVR